MAIKKFLKTQTGSPLFNRITRNKYTTRKGNFTKGINTQSSRETLIYKVIVAKFEIFIFFEDKNV